MQTQKGMNTEIECKQMGVTVKEVAMMLGSSEYTIRKLVRCKQIPHYRVGARILFREETIKRWVEKQEKVNVEGI